MGFKSTDFTVLGANGPTVLTPKAKDVQVKAFAVARTDTAAAIKAWLPADASIIDIHIAGTASDAATTATISLGSTSSSNEYVNGQDVKGAGTFIRATIVGTAIPNTEPIPNTGDLPIYAKYAETGTASTVGAWKVLVYYIR
jgi:hypothetical protein